MPLKPSALCDAFITSKKLDIKQQLFPLDLYQCAKCGHAQISCIVDPETIYEDYIYVSSSSLDLSSHFRKYADEVIKKIKPDNSTLIIDIGSNDGICLKNFKNKGMRVLGIEPAQDIVKEAIKNNIDTVAGYFNSDFAEQINAKKENRNPDPGSLLVPNIQDGLKGIKFISTVVESSSKGGQWLKF